MKRFFAFLFLSLYIYNWAGYLAVFSIQQAHIRREIKKMLKEGVPEHDLVTFAFHTASLERGDYHLQWIKSNEFRYAGGMYDIVRSHSSNDTTYYLCVNDIQEEELFEDLENHVSREMGNHSQRRGLDAFKDMFKDSYAGRCVFSMILPMAIAHPAPMVSTYESIILDIASPPPRFHLSI